jgi:hypothetical protein
VDASKRVATVGIPLVIAVISVSVRWILFSTGILYGETASKMAGLAVAGVIIVAGAVSLSRLRGGGAPTQAASPESIIAVIAGVLGLATAAYGVGELLAPNTPVAAAAPACDGAPVYGARFFAVTQDIGTNSRWGAGRQYAQANRYAGGCALGFDGYCIGPPEPNFMLKTPDQRWLIVHNRNELVASAVVMSQSPESKLGSAPSGRCAGLGGRSQPSTISDFSYDLRSGELSASAKRAVGVGYGLTAVSDIGQVYRAIALGTDTRFSAKLPPAGVAGGLGIRDGRAFVAAAICLGDNVPVVDSLKAELLTLRNSKIVDVQPTATVPASVRPKLAQIACNGSG